MADISNLTRYLRDIANAIKAKKGTTESIPAANFDTEIEAINVGVDTSDATATSSDMAKGKTAYVNGEKIEGALTVTSGVSAAMTAHKILSNALRVTARCQFGTGMIVMRGNTYSIEASNADLINILGLSPEKLQAGCNTLGLEGTAPLTFATIEEMESHTEYPENTFAIVYGTSYIGTYKLDRGAWTQVGDANTGVEMMNILNSVDNRLSEYEGNGGTDEEINAVLDDILTSVPIKEDDSNNGSVESTVFLADIDALQAAMDTALVNCKADENSYGNMRSNTQMYNMIARGYNAVFPANTSEGNSRWLVQSDSDALPCTIIQREYMNDSYLSHELPVNTVKTVYGDTELPSYFVTNHGTVFAYPGYTVNGMTYVNSTTTVTDVDGTPVNMTKYIPARTMLTFANGDVVYVNNEQVDTTSPELIRKFSSTTGFTGSPSVWYGSTTVEDDGASLGYAFTNYYNNR